MLGQLIVGALIEADIAGAWWCSVFLINLPVGIVALSLVRRAVLPLVRAACDGDDHALSAGPRARIW